MTLDCTATDGDSCDNLSDCRVTIYQIELTSGGGGGGGGGGMSAGWMGGLETGVEIQD